VRTRWSARASGRSSRRLEQVAVLLLEAAAQRRERRHGSGGNSCRTRRASSSPRLAVERREIDPVTLHQLLHPALHDHARPARHRRLAGHVRSAPYSGTASWRYLSSPAPPCRPPLEAAPPPPRVRSSTLARARSGASTAMPSSSARVKRSPLRRVNEHVAVALQPVAALAGLHQQTACSRRSVRSSPLRIQGAAARWRWRRTRAAPRAPEAQHRGQRPGKRVRQRGLGPVGALEPFDHAGLEFGSRRALPERASAVTISGPQGSRRRDERRIRRALRAGRSARAHRWRSKTRCGSPRRSRGRPSHPEHRHEKRRAPGAPLRRRASAMADSAL